VKRAGDVRGEREGGGCAGRRLALRGGAACRGIDEAHVRQRSGLLQLLARHQPGQVRRAAAQSGFSSREIFSGAGHDAAYVSRVAPTSMIFVPCRNGISHNEAEFSAKEQCAAGAQVLLQAVLDYDRRLAEQHARNPR